jgi:hypothetical protein
MKKARVLGSGAAALLALFAVSSVSAASIHPDGVFSAVGEIVVSQGTDIAVCDVRFVGSSLNSAQVTSTTFSGASDLCGQLKVVKPWQIYARSVHGVALYGMSIQMPGGVCTLHSAEASWSNDTSQLHFADATGTSCKVSMSVEFWPRWVVY